MAIKGYPERSGSSEAAYIVRFSDSDLPNALVLDEGEGVSITYSAGLATISASGNSTATYVTADDETATLPNSKRMIGGVNVIVDSTSIPGQIIISAQATGGTGADTSLSYGTVNPEPSLSAERSFGEGAFISITDNGANSTLDFGIDTTFLALPFVTLQEVTGLTGERVLVAQDGLHLVDFGAGNNIVVTASSLQNPEYLTFSTDSNLPNSKRFVVDDSNGGLSFVDGGTTVTLSNTASGFKTITVSGQSDVVASELHSSFELVESGGTTITTSGNQITIDSEANQNAFSHFAVTGEGTISSDLATDTINLEGMDGIVLSTVPGTDLLRISGSGITPAQNSFSIIASTGETNIEADNIADTLNIEHGRGLEIGLTPATDTLLISSVVSSISTINVTGQGSVVGDLNDGVTFTSGSGIGLSLSGSEITITNSDPNVDQQMFSTISIANSLESDITPDSTTDTLSLEGLDGIVLKTIPGTDLIQISASGVNVGVTSIDIDATPSGIFDVSGGPVTDSGTITISLDNQTSNVVLAGPVSGGAATPSFRVLVEDDIPNLSAGKITSGTLPVARGGLGTSTAPTDGQIPIGKTDGTYSISNLTQGSGITITNSDGGITIANSAPNVDQDIFQTIEFPDTLEPNIVASSSTDNFKIKGLDDITVVNLGSNTIGISASGVSGGGGGDPDQNLFETFAFPNTLEPSIAAGSSSDTLSFQGLDDITIVNLGSNTIGISASGVGGGSTQNLWETFRFPGTSEPDISASSATDIINLQGDGGIDIVNSGSDTITITATGVTAGDMDYFAATKNSTTQTIGTSYEDVTGWDEDHADSQFSFNGTTGVLTINDTGLYSVFFQITAGDGVATKGSGSAKLQLDSGGGYSDIVGTESWDGMEQTSGNSGHNISTTYVGSFSANDKIKLLANKDSSGDFDIAQDESRLVVTRLSGKKGDPGATGSASTKSVAQGRLTLTSATPVTTSDVTAATTLYYAEHIGDEIGLYDGSSDWDIVTFSNISLSLSGLTANTNYDIFCYNNGGTATLESTAWTNDTTRATALVRQNGILVRSGATTRRYLGTIRITGTTGQCEDSESRRFVYNTTNKEDRSLVASDSTNTWTYNSSTWRPFRNNTTVGTAKIEAVIGEAHVIAKFKSYGLAQWSSGGSAPYRAAVGVGINSTSTNSAQMHPGSLDDSSGSPGGLVSSYKGYPGIGLLEAYPLEAALDSATYTFSGDAGLTGIQTGLHGEMLM